MTTATQTLTEFLLARIAEEEAEVGDTRDEPWRPWYAETAAKGLKVEWTHDGLMIHPARVLAECEAKRRIVEGYLPGHSPALDSVDGELFILPLLALPYVDHPDYREEWRP